MYILNQLRICLETREFVQQRHKTVSTTGVFTPSHPMDPVHLFEGHIFAFPLGIHCLVHGAEISHMQLIDGGVLGCHLARERHIKLKVLWLRIFSGHRSIEAAIHEPWKKGSFIQ